LSDLANQRCQVNLFGSGISLAARLPDWTAPFMNPEKLPLVCSPAKIRRRRSVPRLEEERAVWGLWLSLH